MTNPVVSEFIKKASVERNLAFVEMRNERDLAIIGFVVHSFMTYSEIGKIFGISGGRVCQIFKRTQKRINSHKFKRITKKESRK